MTKRQALKILLSDRWRVYRMSTWRKAATRMLLGLRVKQ